MIYKNIVIYFSNEVLTVWDIQTGLEKCGDLDLDIVSEYGCEKAYYEFINSI